MATSYKRLKIVVLVLFAAFILVTSAIVYLAFNVPELRTAELQQVHEPISITGLDDFTNLKNAVTGNGTMADPFVIEGLAFSVSSVPGIQMNDTDAFVVIRNSTFEPEEGGQYQVDESSPRAISLRNASHVRIEYCRFQSLGAGIEIIGTPGSLSIDVLVTRCVFSSCWDGVRASNTVDLRVTSSAMKWTGNCPITVNNSFNSEITKNRMESFGGSHVYESDLRDTSAGIVCSNCTSTHIAENYLWGGSDIEFFDGIEIVGSRLTVVENNSIGKSGGSSVRVTGSAMVSILHNLLTYGGQIYLGESSNCTISHNHFQLGYYDALIWTSGLVDSVVSDNVIDRGSGMYLDSIDRCLVERNIIVNSSDYSRSTAALWVSGSDSVVARNVISHCTVGMDVSGSNMTIDGNLLSDCYGWGQCGLEVSGSRLRITNNSISNVSGYYEAPGVLIISASDVTIAWNDFADDVEVMLTESVTIHDNLFGTLGELFDLYLYRLTGTCVAYHNTFQDSAVQDWYTDDFDWNLGYPLGGNYWSSHTGTDQYSGVDQDILGADGIGDEPYPIDALNNDSYPLMEPPEFVDGTAPITYPLISGDTGDRGWYQSDLNVTLVSEDTYSASPETFFRLDDGEWQDYVAPVMVAGDGFHTLKYRSEDGAGNVEETQILDLKIDSQSPAPSADMKMFYSFKETLSGIIETEFHDETSGVDQTWAGYLDAHWGNELVCEQEFVVELEDGPNDLYITVADMAGNELAVLIWIDASINYDREPLSPDGPYGPFLIVAIVSDLIVLGVLIFYADKLRFGKMKQRSQRFIEPWQRDKVYDVEDGYSKYVKR